MQIHVLEYLDRTVAAAPDKIALIDETASITFRDVARRASGIASLIAGRTPARNAPVGVYMPKSAAAVTAFWGILASGNAYAPLDVKSPLQRTTAILDDLDPPLILTTEEGAAALRGAGIAEERLATLPPGDGEPVRPLRPAGTIDTDPAYVIYTSGSTGRPKGVVIPHRGIIDYIDWAVSAFRLDSTLVIGNQSPLFFDNSTLDLYVTLATGATLVLIPETLFAFPVRLMEFLATQSVSMIFWVPSVMVNVANTDALAAVGYRGLKTVLFAGEVMPTRHLNYWRRHMPGALFANLYGPTEITVDCTYFIVDRDFADDEPLPIGIPCRNTDILILNERDEPALGSEPGELCVRGSSLALGYWNDPEKTAAAFVQNPLNRHYPERIYRTGDLVTRNERGEILFLGRRDAQIKHLGHRIEPAEIELASTRIGGIRRACVLYDREAQEIALFYEAPGDVTPVEIRKELSRLLPKYMIPTAIHRVDTMPMTANGKIDRVALAEGLRKAEHRT